MMKPIFAFVLLISSSVAARAQQVESKIDEALRKELQDRVKEDQAARNEFIKWMKEHPRDASKPAEQPPKLAQFDEIDRRNREWLKGIVEKHGWPGKSLVGEKGAHDAWLLVQHADRDREFQKKCLELLKAAVAKGEASKLDLAYLTDRVLVAEGKKQIYGTQFKDANGKMEPNPIEDEENVDKRRKEVGLQTLAEYRKQIEAMYGRKN